MQLEAVALDNFGSIYRPGFFWNFYFILFLAHTIYASITCVLALVTEFSKKRLFDIFHLAFLSILFETFEIIFLFLVLILPKIIRQGLAKGLD